jgi:hypothetical protein
MRAVILPTAHNLSPTVKPATPIQGIVMVPMSMQTAATTNMEPATRNILHPSLIGQHIPRDSPIHRLLKTVPAAIRIGQGRTMNTLLVPAME